MKTILKDFWRWFAGSECLATKDDINNATKEITMRLSELSAALNAEVAQSQKALTEIRNKVDALVATVIALQNQINDVTVPAEVTAALAALKAVTQQLDDVVPDAGQQVVVMDPAILSELKPIGAPPVASEVIAAVAP